MHANKGDRIIVESVTVDSAKRNGQILEVMGGLPVSIIGLGGTTVTRANSFPARMPKWFPLRPERRHTRALSASSAQGTDGPSRAH